MNLESIVDRLASEVAPLKLVGGAAKFIEAKENLPVSPAAFVIPGSETAGDNPFMAQMVEQRVGFEFVVVLAVRNLVDSKGASAVDDLEQFRKPIADALLNWMPDGADEGCEFRGGILMDFINGVLWWADTFSTAYTRRSV